MLILKPHILGWVLSVWAVAHRKKGPLHPPRYQLFIGGKEAKRRQEEQWRGEIDRPMQRYHPQLGVAPAKQDKVGD